MNDKLNSINGFHALLHDKGVEIHIPQSKDYNGVLIRTIPEAALCTPLPSSEGANGENNNGKWKRVVINFEVVKYDPTNTNDTFEIFNKFEPPILLIVYISLKTTLFKLMAFSKI